MVLCEPLVVEMVVMEDRAVVVVLVVQVDQEPHLVRIKRVMAVMAVAVAVVVMVAVVAAAVVDHPYYSKELVQRSLTAKVRSA